MIKHIATYILLLFSICFSSQLTIMNGNIEQFSLINSGSYINSIGFPVSDLGKNRYGFSLIEYPANISHHHFFYQQLFKSSFMASINIDYLDFGELQSLDSKFSANDSKIQFSIFYFDSEDLIFGGSVGYLESKISSYSQSIVTYDLGIKKSLINNNLFLGFSLQNGSKLIKNYSNVIETFDLERVINFEYYSKLLDSKLFFDIIRKRNHLIEYRYAIKKYITKNFNICFGKHISTNSNYELDFLDRTSAGFNIVASNYKIDVGVQHLSHGLLNFGCSVSFFK